MKVVAYGPQVWFLLQDQNGYYLLTRCAQSAAEFELLVKLSPDEYKEFHACGRLYIEYLAARINYWSREYASRSVLNGYQHKVTAAINEWRASNAAGA
jgi:hypothetical protein